MGTEAVVVGPVSIGQGHRELWELEGVIVVVRAEQAVGTGAVSVGDLDVDS